MVSSWELIILYKRQLSANTHKSDLVVISFMYNRNIRGPRTVPWGTPDVTITELDVIPSRRTCWVRFENPVISVILNSIKMKLGKEPLMGNSVEGFSKIKKDYINLLLVIEGIYIICLLLVLVAEWHKNDLFGTHVDSLWGYYFWFMMLWYMMCSRTFEQIDVREMGL